MKREEKVRGVRISSLNYGMMLLTCLLFAVTLYTTVQVTRQSDQLVRATEDYIACVEDAALVSAGSDYLTEQVRMYVVTGQRDYADNYFEELYITCRRNQGLEALAAYDPGETAYTYLQAALDYSDQLSDREIYAIKLTSLALGYDLAEFPQAVQERALEAAHQDLDADGLMAVAQNLVFSDDYQTAKGLITENIEDFTTSVTSDTRLAQQASSQSLTAAVTRARLGLIALLALNAVTFALVLAYMIRPIEACVRSVEQNRPISLAGSYELRYLGHVYNEVCALNAKNQELLRHEAEHDPLTGIINRGGFNKLQAKLVESRQPVAFLHIDVDEFKQINDRYGHQVGDRLLQKVARLLLSSFRSRDYVVRMGGDEFAVIMVDTPERLRQVIETKIQRINLSLKRPEDGLPSASISVGIAFSPQGFGDQLYRWADSALYQAKNDGGAVCRVYCAQVLPQPS